MSKDTIYREDAIDEMERIMADHPLQGYEDELLLIDAIKSLPSADRPQGEWIEIGLAFNSYKCSVCGRMLVNITNGKNTVAKRYPYCHCGARMTGARSLRREDIKSEMEGIGNEKVDVL